MVGGAALSDIMMLEPVRASLAALSMPAYLGPFLGTAKILGLIGIWQSCSPFLKSWAYAGLFFDHLGATYAHAVLGFPLLIDAFLAPIYLAMTLYMVHKESLFSIKGPS